jgi:hypothetical protein
VLQVLHQNNVSLQSDLGLVSIIYCETSHQLCALALSDSWKPFSQEKYWPFSMSENCHVLFLMAGLIYWINNTFLRFVSTWFSEMNFLLPLILLCRCAKSKIWGSGEEIFVKATSFLSLGGVSEHRGN